mgnify:CR=1 FL=1
MTPSKRLVAHGALILQTEAHGDPAAPPVLLIMGATASMLWWPDGLVQALAEAGRLVIDYDNWDTGQSTTGQPGPPPYTIDD